VLVSVFPSRDSFVSGVIIEMINVRSARLSNLGLGRPAG
jgi:hypothetical protein